MTSFLLTSLIASIVLTVLLNCLVRLFPNVTEKAEQVVHEELTRTLKEQREQREGSRPRVKVYFPWKALILVSVVLTILVNMVGWLVTG